MALYKWKEADKKERIQELWLSLSYKMRGIQSGILSNIFEQKYCFNNLSKMYKLYSITIDVDKICETITIIFMFFSICLALIFIS